MIQLIGVLFAIIWLVVAVCFLFIALTTSRNMYIANAKRRLFALIITFFLLPLAVFLKYPLISVFFNIDHMEENSDFVDKTFYFISGFVKKTPHLNYDYLSDLFNVKVIFLQFVSVALSVVTLVVWYYSYLAIIKEKEWIKEKCDYFFRHDTRSDAQKLMDRTYCTYGKTDTYWNSGSNTANSYTYNKTYSYDRIAPDFYSLKQTYISPLFHLLAFMCSAYCYSILMLLFVLSKAIFTKTKKFD